MEFRGAAKLQLAPGASGARCALMTAVKLTSMRMLASALISGVTLKRTIETAQYIPTAKLHLRAADTSATFLSTYKRRRHPLIVESERRAGVFREVVLEHISGFTARHTGVIWRLVQDDWGSVCRRRVERALSRLVSEGQLVRNENGYVKRRMG